MSQIQSNRHLTKCPQYPKPVSRRGPAGTSGMPSGGHRSVRVHRQHFGDDPTASSSSLLPPLLLLLRGHVLERCRVQEAFVRCPDFLPAIVARARILVTAFGVAERAGSLRGKHRFKGSKRIVQQDLVGRPGQSEATALSARRVKHAVADEFSQNGRQVLGRNARAVRDSRARDEFVTRLNRDDDQGLQSVLAGQVQHNTGVLVRCRRCASWPSSRGRAGGRSRHTVQRTAPTAMLLYSRVLLWLASPGHRSYRPLVRPWYRSKSRASFYDMLATLRRESVREQVSSMRPTGRGNQDLVKSLLHAVKQVA